MYHNHPLTFASHIRSFAGYPFSESITRDYQVMCSCLAEVERDTGYRDLASIEIERVLLSPDGYTRDGRYFGVGAALFRLFVDDGERNRALYVRATARDELRAALKRLYPNARVGR